MSKSELEQYKEYISNRLNQLTPFFQNYAIGDFSKTIKVPEKEDEFTELLVGLNLMVEDVQELIKTETDKSNKLINGSFTKACFWPNPELSVSLPLQQLL